MSDPIKTNVLIVGAGPSGMTMALALARFGISCTLIDRRETNYEQPRAHALNSRTLEMFSALGMDIEDFKAVATPVEESCWVRFTDTLSGGEYGKLPYRKTCPRPGPCLISPSPRSRR
jgi:2-polyprenyl-6-methoxyphenol hydroxylase-like FAD-dependent oxidoreductase